MKRAFTLIEMMIVISVIIKKKKLFRLSCILWILAIDWLQKRSETHPPMTAWALSLTNHLSGSQLS